MNPTARFLFLVAAHALPLPSKRIVNLLPFGNGLGSLSKYGLGGLSADLGISVDQAASLIDTGSQLGLGTVDEAKMLLVSFAKTAIDTNNQQMTTSEQLSLYGELNSYLDTSQQGLLDEEEFDAVDECTNVTPKVPTWHTSLDELIEGMYGVTTIVAPTSVGKTAFTLSIAVSMACHGVPVIYYENEDPWPLFSKRLDKVRGRLKEREAQLKLRFGLGDVDTMIANANANKDEYAGTVLFFDSPDINVAVGSAEHVPAYYKLYAKLQRLSTLCAAVVVTSQVKRGDYGNIGIESGSGSAAKERFSSLMLALEPRQSWSDTAMSLRVKVLKNRYGKRNVEKDILFDYVSLEMGNI